MKSYFGMSESYFSIDNKTGKNNEHQEKEKYTSNDETREIFLAEFHDGYSFRNLIEYIRGTTTENGVFRFSKDKIIYEKSTSDYLMVNKCIIFTDELTKYSYDYSEPEYSISVDLTSLKSVTRSVSKKDSLRLVVREDEEDKMWVYVVSNTQRLASNQPGSPVSIEKILKRDEYEIKDVYDLVPDVKTPTPHFSKTCTAMHTIKSNYVVIRCFDGNAVAEGKKDGGITTRVEPLGNDILKTNIEEKCSFNIKISLIKIMAKFGSLCSNGIVKIYFPTETSHPLKMSCNIGSYGRVIIYIRSDVIYDVVKTPSSSSNVLNSSMGGSSITTIGKGGKKSKKIDTLSN